MSAGIVEKGRKYVSRLRSLEHIEGEVRARVVSGQWLPGAMLPGRRALAREFGVDLHTVQRAITPLIADGTLRVDSRRGTLVSDHIPHALASPNFTRAGLHAVGTNPIPTARKTISIVSTINPYLKTLESYWPVAILHAFERSIAENEGIDVHYINTYRPDGAALSTEELLGCVDAENVDAVVLVCADSAEDEVRGLTQLLGDMRRLLLNVTPVEPYPKSAPYLTYDNHSAGYRAARHMIGNGYRDLLFFSPVTTVWSESRLAGIREAIAMPGNPPIALRVVSETSDPKAFRETPKDLSAKLADPLLKEGIAGMGIVAANDTTALGLKERAESLGLIAGRDYGLIGFDDSPDARENGLSSLHPPLEDMGREAAGIVARALQGQPIPAQVRLHSHLIPRRSSQRLIGH